MLPFLIVLVCIRDLTRCWVATFISAVAPLLIYNAGAGQSGAFLAGAAFISMSLTVRRPVPAGASAALFILKPHLALVLPVCMVAKGAWKTLFVMSSALFLLVASSVITFGHEAWLAFAISSLNHGKELFTGWRGLFDRSPSLYLGLIQLGLSPSLSIIGQIIGAIAGLSMVFLIWRKSKNETYLFFAMGLAMCISTPKIMHYDAVVLVLPIAILLARLNAGRPDWPLLVLAFFFWNLPLMTPAFRALSFHPGGFIMFATLVLVFIRSRKDQRIPVGPQNTLQRSDV